MEEGHIYAFCPFGIATHAVGFQYQVKILTVPLLLRFPDGCSLEPGVVSAPGYAGHGA